MSKFIFENEKGVEFSKLPSDKKILVIEAFSRGGADILWGDGSWSRVGGTATSVSLTGVYRVLAVPYTLEDALKEIASIAIAEGDIRQVNVNDAMDLLRKLAASMEGDK